MTLVDDMLGEDSHFKLYFEKLRQSPLPVVPFIGKESLSCEKKNSIRISLANNQTRIAQMKEKHNLIVLPSGDTLINFRKFQQIGEHLSEIQQYQNMPYDIVANSDIQRELKRLNPMKGFSDENSFQNYLVKLKENIEPIDGSPRAFVSVSHRVFVRSNFSFTLANPSSYTKLAIAFTCFSSFHDAIKFFHIAFANIKSIG